MTNDNRFTPPNADVADPEPQPLLPQRPKQILVAVALLWFSFALGFPAWFLSSTRDPEMSFNTVVLVITALLFAFGAFLNVMIYQGKNWARIVFVVFVALAVLMLLLPADEVHPAGRTEQVINLVDLAVELAALVLLFTRPGSLWFKRRQ